MSSSVIRISQNRQMTYPELRLFFEQRFNLDEIKNLCFDLEISDENFPQPLNGLVRELLRHIQRLDREDELVDWLKIHAQKRLDAHFRYQKKAHGRNKDKEDTLNFYQANKPSRQEKVETSVPSLNWMHIPSSEFVMGSGSKTQKLLIRDFFISKTEITNAQYSEYVREEKVTPPRHWMGKNTPPAQFLDHPVVYVSWYDALAYCKWLSKKTSYPVILPSEAEWEKAAGWDPKKNAKRTFPWGNHFNSSVCNVKESGNRKTTNVLQFPGGASAYGVLDMSGNVWEWTRSLHGKSWLTSDYPSQYSPDDGRENLEAPNEVRRILCGGAFYNVQAEAEVTARYNLNPNYKNVAYGFRVVYHGK